jgi:GNAT superfamily N-acetyltransferase
MVENDKFEFMEETRMSEFRLLPVTKQDKHIFIHDVQEAFQFGFEAEFGSSDEKILPEKDIEESFATKGSEAYFAVSDGEVVGGTIIVIDDETKKNHLDLLYVKVGCQSKGTGQKIWKAIEELHPETEVWETCTPYFEKRNIHFYVNRLGFHIVEFYNQQHKDPHQSGEPAGGMPEGVGDEFFRFEKVMK